MKGEREPLWTIEELSAETAAALAVGYKGPPNDRVREIPDLRTIRYYTTLGLIDRPLAMRGRTALYGRRHLLQLVAIKRLQSRGLTLADVQRHLVGLSDAALARLARVSGESAGAAGAKRPTQRSSRRSLAFWKTQPAAPQPAPIARAAAPEAQAKQEAPRPTGSAAPLQALQAVRLRDEITLLLAAPRPLDDDDVRALHAAAQTLIHLLEMRGLVRPRGEAERGDA